MKDREAIIRNYINAYNKFDVEGMLADMAEDIVFQNISGNEVNMTLNGIDAFREQAEQTKAYFSTRHQAISNIEHRGDETEVAISYVAILAINLPNGMKAGDEIKLSGRSVFKFVHDKIITALTDLS
ncbi:nuclear transport factor 2 family protein [Mucilaginibacter conchicola]|uniref:Nuclear transport factor 2 family protein n=1 Tax=Mucilaginibacter conchicola TaxID=2303333 RepID=A0A372NSY3_9SPHI|nr:nuclear transport factor 2 family protein [Mucilaginibacter conchicola]RFZ92355.1 nuclear transport factor 2 family protein [Mucilaginibacter conchicola]